MSAASVPANGFFTAPQFAERLGVEGAVVTAWARAGRIRAEKALGTWRIDHAVGLEFERTFLAVTDAKGDSVDVDVSGFWRVSELAPVVVKSPSALRRAAAAGKIPAFLWRGEWHFPPDDPRIVQLTGGQRP